MTRKRSELRDYQERIANQVLESRALLLNIPMGLGKSAIAITAIADYLLERPDAKILIVAPLRVAMNTWPDEIRGWEHTKDIVFSLVLGTPSRRMGAMKRKASVYITNFENMRWLMDQFDPTFDMVVVDESSKLKSGKKKSASGKPSAFGSIAEACARASKRLLLTGTMAPNGVHNLWGQAFCLDQGQRLGSTRSAFERRWFDTGYMGWDMKPIQGAEEEIVQKLSDIVVSIRQSESIALPPVVSTTHYSHMSPVSQMHYRELQRDLVSLPINVSAPTRSVMQNKLMQICNGAVYDDDGEVVSVNSDKADILEEMMDACAPDNVLVLYSYRFDLRNLRVRFPYSETLSLDNLRTVDRWNRGEIRMLLAHPASCAHGLNLQFGGFRTIWFGLTWDLELYQQANARIPRPGQKSALCYQHHIIAKGTVEERVLERLNEKNAHQERINECFY